MTAAPWQVYVPGFPGEEHASFPDAVRAYRRLKRADRRRPRSPVAVAAPASSPIAATDPVEVRGPAHKQSSSYTSPLSAPHAGAAIGARDHLTHYEGRT